MSFVKLWVHGVWSVKYRKPLLLDSIRQEVFRHIKENAQQKGIYLDTINGHLEHVHTLLSLKSSQSVDDIMQMLKGESSFWINKNKLTQVHFSWQTEFFAVSVSESGLYNVRNYIKRQEIHHRGKSFQEEYDEFMRLYKF